MSLDHSVVLVTGSTSGIGLATARAFARRGAEVVVTGISERELAKARPLLGGCRAHFVPADLTSAEAIAGLFRWVADRCGTLDVLVNNAGVCPASGPLVDNTVEELRELVSVNVRAVFLCTRHAIALMRLHGGGAIVNVSSSLAAMPISGAAAYSATKRAVTILSHALAERLGPESIHVVAIEPGAVDTAMSRTGAVASDDPRNLGIVRLHPHTVAEAIVALVEQCQSASPKLLRLEPQRRPPAG